MNPDFAKDIRQKKKKADIKKLENLFLWLKAKRGRVSAVAEIMGCTTQNITHQLKISKYTGYNSCKIPTQEWYLNCLAAAKQVEDKENGLSEKEG